MKKPGQVPGFLHDMSYSMSPESGHRFWGKGMRKNKELSMASEPERS
ncbi:hypothetical protein [Rhizobium wenxiniae]|nr:hypothetical protein [Rhizobium wenxiniae]